MFEETEIVMGFFPGFGVLASVIGGLVMNKMAGGRGERMHGRQLGSEDRRHAASIAHDRAMAEMRRDEYRNYIAQERAREEAFRARKAATLGAVGGGLHGVPGGLLEGLAYADSAAMPAPGATIGGGGLMPVTTAGMPADVGGMSMGDLMGLIAMGSELMPEGRNTQPQASQYAVGALPSSGAWRPGSPRHRTTGRQMRP